MRIRPFLCILAAMALTASAGEAPPAKAVPLTEEEIKAEQAKETPEQKALRAEIGELAKKGEKVFFAANCDGTDRVYAMKPDGSGVECLTPDAVANAPHASTDGKRLIMNYGVPKEEAVKLPQDPSFKRPADGSGPCLAVLDIETKKAAPLCRGDEAYWHPNGKTVCYNTDTVKGVRKIGIFDVEKKTEKIIAIPGLPKSAMFPNFSPDGKWLLIGGYPFTLAEVNAEGTDLAAGGKVQAISAISGCNNEIAKDGKAFVYVIDTHGEAGGWLCWSEFKPGEKMAGKRLPLGWQDASVNYFPDLSPDGKYMIYAHAEMKAGVESWTVKTKQELYVTRFPDCKTTVRVTWNGAANYHPNWWGPATK
jgi:Tol biopolymer transport system component